MQKISPLYCSVNNNDIEGVEILLATPGINQNIINNYGKTLLDIAHKNKNETMIALLTNSGAKTSTQAYTITP